ncbi:DUF1488 domain-containing protein [Bradyrhizobium sp. CCGB12]|uniref:DUF1488 family protein n=1 Tax=Bradyrhizobium sp. CCGB12 TaxID=2949632 RepID=UPI0020B236E2|nr:DUF1488 family protein [Bradyrhizobium sp. CCGB12]MCP3390713.1 DUF1488 domain-containing protein [Bradyrhizobium sp. CCGB12]
MPLRPDPLGKVATDELSQILFVMLDGDKRVLCKVESGALTDRAIADGADENDLHATFQRHRDAIEAIASQNYDKGQISPTVSTYQLTPLP